MSVDGDEGGEAVSDFSSWHKDARDKSALHVEHFRKLLSELEEWRRIRSAKGTDTSTDGGRVHGAGPGAEGGIVVLELFCGIGGMRCGMERAGLRVKKCIAVDTSPLAGSVYLHNVLRGITEKEAGGGASSSRKGDGETEKGRGECTPTQPETQRQTDHQFWARNVEKLSASELNAARADLWTLSPPCQPFTTTKGAQRRDQEDLRCSALTHLSSVLPSIEQKPRWIFLENVGGFLGSRALSSWEASLSSCGYSFQRWLLCPADFGIPNKRQRFFHLAERSSRFSFSVSPLSSVPRPSASTATARAVTAVEGVSAGGLGEHAVAVERGIETEHSAEGDGRVNVQQTREKPLTAKSLSLFLDVSELNERQIPSPCLRSFQEKQADIARTGGCFPCPPCTLRELLGDSVLLPWCHSKTPASSGTQPRAEGGSSSEVVSRSPGLVTQAEALSLLLSEEQMAKAFARGLSYVTGDTPITFCFTSGYGKVLHKSSGSLLIPRSPPSSSSSSSPPTVQVEEMNEGRQKIEEGKQSEENESKYTQEEAGTDAEREKANEEESKTSSPPAFLPRFFSPEELLRLFAFPGGFHFPLEDGLSLRHKWKLVGQSVNVTVVAVLLKMLVRPGTHL